MEFIENHLLAPLTTFKIGGPARYFCTVTNVDEIHLAMQQAQKEQCQVFVLGNGSNCLFSDRGFDGLIIHNKISFCEEVCPGQYHVGAGYSFSKLGLETARAGFGGLEFAAGIPGTVGGGLIMNVGANGQQMSDILVSTEYIDENGDQMQPYVKFGYRNSSLQGKGGIVTSICIQLSENKQAVENQKKILLERKKKQPLNARCAGCCFKNPAHTTAGALIDQAGLKGKSIGGAQISHVHANFIINTGSATAQDVLDLMEYVREIVARHSGILLEPEVRIIERG